MKKILTLVLCLYLSPALQAQAPQKMNYQAIVHNSNNSLASAVAVGVKVSLLQGSAIGSTVYAETHNRNTDVNGLLSLEIGTGTVISGNFSAINWAGGPYFIKTEFDTKGGTNYTISSTSQLLSVPYALNAANGNKPGTAVGEMQYWNGTAWVAIPPGTQGQSLNFCNGYPSWAPCPPLVAPPTDSTLWITGTAVASNYQNPLPSPYDSIQKFTRLSNTLYELTIAMPGGGDYRLIQKQGDWSTQYHKVSGTWDTGTFEQNNALPVFDGPPVAGNYKITIDFKVGTYTVVKL